VSDPVFKYVDATEQVVSRTWPDGRLDSCSVLAQEFLDWVAAGNTPLPPDPSEPQPNPDGFVEAIKAALGGIVGANALMKMYPAFYDAVATGTWPDVQALIIDAKSTSVLTAAQYTAFGQLAQEFNIPITLP
jgi:hypothetical protein